MVGTCKVMIAISTAYEAMCHRQTSQLSSSIYASSYISVTEVVTSLFKSWRGTKLWQFFQRIIITVPCWGHMYSCGSQSSTLGVISQRSPTWFWDGLFHRDWDIPVWARLAGQQAPEIFLSLCPQRWITSEHHHAQPFIGHCVLHLGPCTCLASTLATAASP